MQESYLRDAGLTLGLGRFPGEGKGNPLQYSCLENPMDGRAWWGYSSQGCKEPDTTGDLAHSTANKWQKCRSQTYVNSSSHVLLLHMLFPIDGKCWLEVFSSPPYIIFQFYFYVIIFPHHNLKTGWRKGWCFGSKNLTLRRKCPY